MNRLIAVIIAFVALVAADDEWKPLTDVVAHRKIQSDCIKESALTKEQMEKMHQFPDEKEVRDYVLCHVKKVGIFTEESGYIADRVIAQLPAIDILPTETAREFVGKCATSSEQTTSPAIRAYRGVKCMIENTFKGHR